MSSATCIDKRQTLLTEYSKPKTLFSVLHISLDCTTGLCVDRHSRLSGSRDLDIWVKSGADSVREAYKEHLMGPIIAVKDELFKTFRYEVFMLAVFHLL